MFRRSLVSDDQLLRYKKQDVEKKINTLAMIHQQHSYKKKVEAFSGEGTGNDLEPWCEVHNDFISTMRELNVTTGPPMFSAYSVFSHRVGETEMGTNCAETTEEEDNKEAEVKADVDLKIEVMDAETMAAVDFKDPDILRIFRTIKGEPKIPMVIIVSRIKTREEQSR